VPAQAVDVPGPFADQVLAVIDQQTQLRAGSRSAHALSVEVGEHREGDALDIAKPAAPAVMLT